MDADRIIGTGRGVTGRFVGLFLLYVTAFLLLEQLPHALAEAEQTFTAYAAFLFWSLLPIPVVQHGPFLTFYNFPMVVTSECTALHYLAIFSAGVLAYQQHSRSYRFAGIVLGAAAILFLNTVRLGVLGLVGHYARDLFDLVHVYIWQGAFALAMLFLWWAWMQKKLRVSKRSLTTAGIAVSVSLLALWVLDLVIAPYAALVSVALDPLSGIVASLGGFSLSVTHAGSVIESITSRGTLHNDLFYEAINFVVLAGIASVAAASLSWRDVAKRTAVSALLLSCQHLVFLLLYGTAFARGMELERFTTLLWAARGFNMIAPMLLWLLASRLFPARRKPLPGPEQQ